MALSSPEPIASHHILESFDCGKPILNDWLKRRALTNHLRMFTSVLVVHEDNVVKGYYGLAPTSIVADTLPRNIRTGQPPDPIPCILIGQLAVDRSATGLGIGSGLLKHALFRCVEASQLVGGRALLVKAVDTEAAIFWQSKGFLPSKLDPLLYCRSMDDIKLSLKE